MLYQQFEQLKQTPDGQALIKSLFTDAGIMPQLLTDSPRPICAACSRSARICSRPRPWRIRRA